MMKTTWKSISLFLMLFLPVVLLPGCASFDSSAERKALEISSPTSPRPAAPAVETPAVVAGHDDGAAAPAVARVGSPLQGNGAAAPPMPQGASPFQDAVDKQPLPAPGAGQAGKGGVTTAPTVTSAGAISIPESLGSAAPAQGIQQLGGGLSLNFDQAGISEVITAFAEMLKINYMVMADLHGQVTIQTSGVLASDDLLGLFYQILQANGLTAIKDGDLYKIVPFKEAARVLPDIRTGSLEGVAASPGVLIQVVPLKYINSPEMIKILTPFLSTEGSIIANDSSRTLVIVDQRLNLLKAMQLIATFDVDLFANIKYRFFQPRNVTSKDILPLLTKFMGLYNKNAKEEIEFFSLDKINSILVITASDRLLARVDELMNELDKPSQEAESHIYIYFLKNSQAGEMSELLSAIFTATVAGEKAADKGGPQAEKAAAAGGANPFAAKPAGATSQAAAAPVATPVKSVNLGDFGGGSLRGQVKISKDEIRNALIIEAIPADYQIIEKVLLRLDIMPRQVLISVKVVQVQLDDSLNLGVEWSFNKANSGLINNPSTLNAGVSNFWNLTGGSVTGLKYLIGETNQWNASLSALATNNKVNILSSPSVLASDNKAAKIEIATEIPVASSVSTYDSSVSKTQTEIQYRTTGVLLDVTPHINEYGLVSMEVSQEVSDAADAVSVGGASYPAFLKRSVKTTLTVNDGQTVVIGGLISEKKSNNDSGVPWLSQLPLLGWVFGNTADKVSKTELVILITPRVVANLADVDAVTREFSRKLGYEPRTGPAK
jgi:general secretion pathway protein D